MIPSAWHNSHNSCNSAGVSMAPVGLLGDDKMSPFKGGRFSCARRSISCRNSVAVKLNSSFKGMLATGQAKADKRCR